MENLHLNDSSGQSYGYVLYEAVIFGGGHLHSRDHVRDRAQVKRTGTLSNFTYINALIWAESGPTME